MKWLATDILRDAFKQDLLYIVKTFESESARGEHHCEEESRNPELHRGNSRSDRKLLRPRCRRSPKTVMRRFSLDHLYRLGQNRGYQCTSTWGRHAATLALVRAFLVRTHQARIAHHIGGENGGQLAFHAIHGQSGAPQPRRLN
jgi:hypothetical protein